MLVSVDDADDLRALQRVLATDAAETQDVVVVCVGQEAMGADCLPDRVTDVFSEIVFSAEKAGKPVKLLALTGKDAARTLLGAAVCLEARRLWIGAGRGGCGRAGGSAAGGMEGFGGGAGGVGRLDCRGWGRGSRWSFAWGG